LTQLMSWAFSHSNANDCTRRILFDTYGEVTGDRPGAALVHFYQSYRGCVA
jgi:aminoglycoside phosphotransferase family enzyme